MNDFIKINDSNFTNNEYYSNSFEYNEYFLLKENNIFRIIIRKLNNEILVKSKNYEIIFNLNKLIKLTNLKFSSLEEAYELLMNIFEENKVILKEIIIYKSLKLSLNIDNNKDIEINLIYNKQNKNSLIKELYDNYNEIKIKLNHLINENQILKNQIKKLQKDYNGFNSKNRNVKLNTNPKYIQILKNITKDAYGNCFLDNSFTVFKSISNILYLIYASDSKSIIAYDLSKFQKITEIKNAHNNVATNFRHYLDIINKRDLILSISAYENNIKLWNVNNFECLLNLQNINKSGFLYSACFLNDNNQNFIITSNYDYSTPEQIKIFNFKGEKIKEISNSSDMILFIDIYYDKNLSRNYIISGNKENVKSYDYSNNKLYHVYFDDSKKYRKDHCSAIINIEENIIKLIESSYDGNIRIWNFHSALLLNKINLGNISLRGLCLWNNNYLFVGCDDKTVKLIDLKNLKIEKVLKEHYKEILTIKKIIYPKFGECLISQGYDDDQIKQWINEI